MWTVVKHVEHLLLCQIRDINSKRMRNVLAEDRATFYHAQLGLLDKGRVIEELVSCNMWTWYKGLANFLIIYKAAYNA